MMARWLPLLATLLTTPAWPQSGPDPQATLADTRTEERGVLDQIGDIDRELIAVREHLAELQRQVDDLETSRLRHADEQASAQAVLERQREGMAQRMAALYRQEHTGLARVVFGADDPADLRRRSRYLLAIVDADLDRFQEYAAALKTRRTAAEAVEHDVQALAALRAELQLQEADLRDRRSKRVDALGQIQSRRQTALRALSEMSDARRDLGSRLTTGSWGGDGATSGSFRTAYGHLPWPTSGRLLHRFGSYVDDRTGQQADSKGIDIAADYGTPVRAVFAGVVTLANYVRGYGQTVAVDHSRYTTVYAHLGGIKVPKGQRVAAGDVLGLVGNTGLTDGAGYILTFEVRYNRTAQDPLTWLSPR